VMEHAELTFAQLCKTYSKMEHASWRPVDHIQDFKMTDTADQMHAKPTKLLNTQVSARTVTHTTVSHMTETTLKNKFALLQCAHTEIKFSLTEHVNCAHHIKWPLNKAELVPDQCASKVKDLEKMDNVTKLFVLHTLDSNLITNAELILVVPLKSFKKTVSAENVTNTKEFQRLWTNSVKSSASSPFAKSTKKFYQQELVLTAQPNTKPPMTRDLASLLHARTVRSDKENLQEHANLALTTTFHWTISPNVSWLHAKCKKRSYLMAPANVAQLTPSQLQTEEIVLLTFAELIKSWRLMDLVKLAQLDNRDTMRRHVPS
jgi:hypothetical protein